MFETISEILSSGWLQTAILWISLASTLLIIIVILSENRNPVKSLAWVTILLLLPIVGLILYLFFGRNIKNKRMISRRNRRRLRRAEKRIKAKPEEYGLSEQSITQIKMGRSLTGAQFYPDNSIEFLHTGVDKFEALIKDLKAAKHSINIQYYIIEDDEAGNTVADILIEKATAGIPVRVIYDSVGSLSTSKNFFKRLKLGGVQVAPFFKVNFPFLGTQINWRNHRKIVVIDDTVGYIGGMNIANRYAKGHTGKRTWRDTHLRITGPIVAALQYSFAIDWHFTGGELIAPPESTLDHTLFRRCSICNVGAQLLTAGPTNQWSNVAMAFQKAIANAKKRVFIQTPYFLPDEGILKTLQAAALSLVDVRIMIPERSDSILLTYASASYIAECIKAGIKFYTYQPGMLHCKTLLVDDELVSVGSTNFDFRSFDFNFEANIFLFSRDANEAALHIFEEDAKQCRRILPTEWRHRPLFNKVAESILRLFSPIL